MKKISISLSITGSTANELISKINELNKLKISEASLFLEKLSLTQRKLVYNDLKKSGINKIPLVHLRYDMSREEIKMLDNNYKVDYFTIHENFFNVLNSWHGFIHKLYLEMSTDNHVADNVDVDRIGGFCVDLAHYKKQSVLKNKDYEYVHDRRNRSKLFVCNHLSGYDYAINMDMHKVNSVKDFFYLKDLPLYVFGKHIALEFDNSIKEQIKIKSEIETMVNNVTLKC